MLVTRMMIEEQRALTPHGNNVPEAGMSAR